MAKRASDNQLIELCSYALMGRFKPKGRAPERAIPFSLYPVLIVLDTILTETGIALYAILWVCQNIGTNRAN